MDNSIYNTPKSELIDRRKQQQRHYVVALPKLVTLYIATFGLYVVYWFYAHWREYKFANHVNIWPVPRAVFSIFFTHSLFRYIDQTRSSTDQNTQWNGQWLASLYVITAIAITLSDVISEYSLIYTTAIAFTLLLYMLQLYPIYRAQKVANTHSEDPTGRSNKRLTLANWFWILLGVVIWALVIFGLYQPETGF